MTMYARKNFPSKKALKEAVANSLTAGGGESVTIFSAGIGEPPINGKTVLSGPHFPQAHRWYAEVDVKDGKVVKVK